MERLHSIKCLVVTIDENLTFDEHVRNVCKASYYHIRGLRQISAAMSKDTACTVALAIVGSRLVGWNIQGQPQQTAVCPEYSDTSCLASPHQSTLATNSCKDNIQNCDACVQNM